MAFNRVTAAIAATLLLAGCAGGENLYGGPAAKFKQAVDTTASLTRDYTVLDERMRTASKTSTLAKDNGAVLQFSSSDCKGGKACAIVSQADGQALTKSTSKDAQTVSPIIELMAKMQVYASTLSAIAEADTSAQLQQVGTSVQKAYDDLLTSVRTNNLAAVKDIKVKPGDAIVEVAASIYLERERVKALAALVKRGDPVVAAVSDTLGSMVGEMQASYMQTQSDTVQNLVLNFNVLGGQVNSETNALNKREIEAMRRDLLNRALTLQHTLNGLNEVDAKAAFARMKAAHAQLLAALELAQTPKGISEAALATLGKAMDDFTDAALQAVDSMNTVKEWY